MFFKIIIILIQPGHKNEGYIFGIRTMKVNKMYDSSRIFISCNYQKTASVTIWTTILISIALQMSLLINV